VVIWRRAPGLIDTWESSQDSGLKGKHPVRKEGKKRKKEKKEKKKKKKTEKRYIFYILDQDSQTAFQTESTTTQDSQTRTTYSPTAYQHRSR
jgi:hypothetical protein